MIYGTIWMRLLHTLSISAMTGIWFQYLAMVFQSELMTRYSYSEEYSILISTLLFGITGLFIGLLAGNTSWYQIVKKYHLDERTIALSYVVFSLVGLLACSIL